VPYGRSGKLFCDCVPRRNRHIRPRNNSLDLPFVLSARPIRRLVQEASMNGLIYLIGLIVVVMAILSFLGLR
jgi:hypothetical protein